MPQDLPGHLCSIFDNYSQGRESSNRLQNAATAAFDSRSLCADKDTFELAFALAGKQKEFRKVQYWPRGGLSAAIPPNEYVKVSHLHQSDSS